jgi:hypothetical protein
MVFLILTFKFRFVIFNSSQIYFLVCQSRSEESSWLKTELTDKELKDCSTAGKPGGYWRK